MAHILFTVFNSTDVDATPIAYSSIPLSCFRYGLRTVFLYDEKGNKKGDYSFASLLIRTACESWIVSADDNGKHKDEDEIEEKEVTSGKKGKKSKLKFGL